MGKLLSSLFGVAAIVAWAWTQDANTTEILAVAAAGFWGSAILIIPWDLHYKAKAVLADLHHAKVHELTIPDESIAAADKIKRITLFAAVAGHSLSAIAATFASVLWDVPNALLFAYLFMGTLIVRPAAAYMKSLRTRLGLLATEARFPRIDTAKLRVDVEDMEMTLKSHKNFFDAIAKDIRTIRTEATQSDLHATERHALLEAEVRLMAEEFQSTVTKLTSNAEVITGLKAIMRMAREA